VGGVPDVIGRNERGLLVPRRDPRAVADAIRELLDQPAMAEELGRNGREYVYPAYDVATLVASIERMYTELAIDRGLVRALRHA
ncbi:MAG: glycosyltransferase, partial [Vicinamibacteraceae bacterium]